MDDKNKQKSAISDQSSDKPEEINQPEPVKEEVEVAKSESDKAISEVESTPDSVIASPAESGVNSAKQSSSEENQIAAEPSAPRNDENDLSESGASATDEPAQEPAVVKPSKSDNPARNASHSDAGGPNAKWYVVHTYSGHENKVAATLKQRIESEGLEKKILDILVPTQDKIEIRSGKKQTIKEKVFPGYILVKMDLDDVSWLAVRTTQGVTSFVGIGNKPTPISDAEVQTIVKFTQEEAPAYKQIFAVSDTVKIVDGPFAEFIGKVDFVDEEKGKVRVLVSIFGRETPVELDFLQVQKI